MASTRRAVIAGTGAVAAAVATSAAALACSEPGTIAMIQRIADAEAAHRKAQRTFDKAVAAFVASIPEPHWSINFNDRDRALCGSWSSVRQSSFAELEPRFLPTEDSLERDLADCLRHFPERYGWYRRLTRRLKARVERHLASIKRSEERFRLGELEADVAGAERQIIQLADEIFEAPATTPAAVQVQARMLTVFAKQIGSKSWAYCQAMKHGHRLAVNVLALGVSARA